MRHNQRGFTLIELMIVVGIIGMLTMIAMPSYQSFVKKTKITEGISLFGDIKNTVIERYSLTGKMQAKSFEELGFSKAQLYKNNPRKLAMLHLWNISS